MADRRRQTLLLVASRHDWLWLPSSAPTAAGFVPAKVEPCGDCGGSGRVYDRFQRPSKCARCQGKGRLAFDPMDPLHLPVGSAATGSSAPRARRTVLCDACAGAGVVKNERCHRCGGEGRRHLHEFELRVDVRDVEERDPLAAAIEERNRQGSYAHLDRALDQLRLIARRQHGAFLAAIDEAVHPLPVRLELPLRWIVARMPDPIRVPADLVANSKLLADRRTRAKGRGSHPAAMAQRAKEMRRHARDGKSPGWIAAEYGVSRSTVYDVVNGTRSL